MTTNGRGRYRVVVADDNKSMVQIVTRIVSEQFDVVDVVHNGEAAVDAVLKLEPDVLILDVVMTVLDGIQVVRRLKALRVDCRIIILTGLEDKQHIDAAMAAGANGFVFKARMGGDLLHAMREVLAGRTFVSASRRRSGD